MEKKLLTEINTDDLLNSLENEDTPIVNVKSNYLDVHHFLSKFSIKPGNNYVHVSIFYLLYNFWSEKSVKQDEFEYEVDQYFPSSKLHDNLFFHLNLTTQEVEDAMSLYINQIKYRKKSQGLAINTTKYKKHFEKFLAKYNLEKGPVLVEPFVLYYLYDKFVYRVGKKNLFAEPQFATMCKKYFDYKDMKKQTYHFYVSENIKELVTEEKTSQLRSVRKRHHAQKNRKKKRKKQQEIQEPRSNSEPQDPFGTTGL